MGYNNNNKGGAGGSGVSEKRISSISCLCVAGLKVRRPTKHVLWEKKRIVVFFVFFVFFRIFPRFLFFAFSEKP